MPKGYWIARVDVRDGALEVAAPDVVPVDHARHERLRCERLRGDQLQTSAIFDEDFRVLSKLTDPNDYAGPGTGYALTEARRAEIDAIRQARSSAELTLDQNDHRDHVVVTDVEPARQGSDPREVVIGLSPAWGRSVWLSLCGLPIGEVLRQISAGLEEEGCVAEDDSDPAAMGTAFPSG